MLRNVSKRQYRLCGEQMTKVFNPEWRHMGKYRGKDLCVAVPQHVIPGIDDPTCGIAVAAKMLMRRGVGQAGEVWVHSMWSFFVIKACFGALLSGKRLVRMPHGCTDPVKLQHHWWKKMWVVPIEKWLFRHADRIVATCEDEVAWILRFEPNVKKTEIISLAGEIKRTVQDIHTPHRFLYIGRLHPLKGLEFLLEAMPVDAKMVLIGKDEGEGAKLRNIATQRCLDVEFRGVVEEKDKDCALNWCDVLVLPTLSENFGLVVAEALERGKRVITTDGAPAWGEELEFRVERLGVSVEEDCGLRGDERNAGEIWSGYGGRLLYLKGYRAGGRDVRVSLLQRAMMRMAAKG